MIGPRITQNLIEKQATKLRFPVLLWITGGLFVMDFVIPDIVPFVDEILLGVMMVILSRFKQRKTPEVIVQEPQAKE